MNWLGWSVLSLIVLAVMSPGLRVAAIIAAVGLMIFGIYRGVKKTQADEVELFAALAAHIRRKHDAQWCTKYRGNAWWLVIWLEERKFYFAKAHTPFAPNHFHGEQDIREWSIHRSREVSRDRYWDEYAVNIVVKDTESPLIKIYCGKDEATAYKINESFNQMFGAEPT